MEPICKDIAILYLDSSEKMYLREYVHMDTSQVLGITERFESNLHFGVKQLPNFLAAFYFSTDKYVVSKVNCEIVCMN